MSTPNTDVLTPQATEPGRRNLLDDDHGCDNYRRPGLHGPGHVVGAVRAYQLWYWRPTCNPEIAHLCAECIDRARADIKTAPEAIEWGGGIRVIVDHDIEPDHCQVCGKAGGGKHFIREDGDSDRGLHVCSPECSWAEKKELPPVVRA